MDNVDHLVTTALAFHREGRYAEARTAYRQVLALRPDYWGVLHMLAMAELRLDHAADALRIMICLQDGQRDLEGFEHNFIAVWRGAIEQVEALIDVDDYRQAFALLALMLTAAPADRIVLILLGHVRSCLERDGMAPGTSGLDFIRRAFLTARADRDNSDFLTTFVAYTYYGVRRGLYMARSAVFIDALTDHLAATGTPILHVYLGNIFYEKKNYSEAIPHLKYCDQVNTSNSNILHVYFARLHLAKYYMETANFSAAERHITAAGAMDTGGIDHHLYLLLLEELGRHTGRPAAPVQRVLATIHQSTTISGEAAENFDRQRLDRIPARPPQAAGENRHVARWPTFDLSDDTFEASVRHYILKDLALPSPRIARTAVGLTIGSCFAHNIAASLIKQGMNVYRLGIHEDVNTTFATRLFFDYMIHGVVDDNSRAMDLAFAAVRDTISSYIRNAGFIVLTVGVAPVTFVAESGAYIFLCDRKTVDLGYKSGKIVIRTTGVGENKENILKILAAIRTLNPRAPVFLTVSPIPLSGSGDFSSAIIGDCVSKSVLRTAVFEVMSEGHDGLYYWPSFEIVRWMSGHYKQAFFGEYDSRHVNGPILDTIMKLFIDHCCAAPLAE